MISTLIAIAGTLLMAFGLVLAYANAGGFISKVTAAHTIDMQRELIDASEKRIELLRDEVADLTALVRTLTAQVGKLESFIASNLAPGGVIP